MKTVDELVYLLNRALDEQEHGRPRMTAEPEGPVAEAKIFRLADFDPAVSSREFTIRAFRAVLKRDPDEEGLAYYAETLDHGERSREQLVRELLAGDEGRRSGCAVIGVSSGEEVVAAIAAECLRLTQSVARIEGTLAALTERLDRIPRAQEVFLRTIEEYMRDFAARLTQAADAPPRGK